MRIMWSEVSDRKYVVEKRRDTFMLSLNRRRIGCATARENLGKMKHASENMCLVWQDCWVCWSYIYENLSILNSLELMPVISDRSGKSPMRKILLIGEIKVMSIAVRYLPSRFG